MALTPFDSPDQAPQAIQPKQIIRGETEANPTKEQIAQLRQIASQLMGERSNSASAHGMLGGIGLGLENATGKITGALDYNRASDLERELNKKTGSDDRSNVGSIVNPEAGNQPTPSPSAANIPSAASGVAAAAPPFPQSQSPSQDQRVASLGPLPQQPTTTTTPSQGGQPSPKLDLGGGVQEKAMRTSARGETGKSSLMGAMFNISPDAGGSKSYGPFGLNSKSGSLNTFIKEHPELGFKSNTPEEWRRVAATHTKDGLMVEAHKDWYNKHIMGGLDKDLTSRGTPAEIAKDPKVQHYMADRKVQMGDVGLNASVRYANVNAQTPEQWIQRISQADRQRIPYNFPTYLRDNPNNAHGLVNRIYQRQGEALAGADPASTAAMVDDIRGRNAAGRAVLSGPDSGSGADFRVAQNTNPNAAPQGSAAQQFGDYLYNRAIHGSPLSPAEARTMWELKMGANPQYGPPNDFGIGFRSAPGQIPQVYRVPGTAGKIENIEGVPGGKTQTTIGPDGKPHMKVITPEDEEEESNAGATASPPTTPPKAAPTAPTAPAPATGGAVVQNKPQTAPTAPATAQTGGPLTTPAPQVAKAQVPVIPGAQYAMADPKNAFVGSDGKFDRDRLTQVAQATSAATKPRTAPVGEGPIETPDYDLSKPITPIEKEAAAAVARANAAQPSLDVMPNRYQQAQELGRTAKGMGKIDVLKNAQNLQKADTAAQEEGRKAEIKTLREKQEKYQNDLSQAVALGPDIKLARNILNSKDFEAGPVSWIVTGLRSLSKEGKDMFQRFAEDSADPASKDFWNRTSKYFDSDHSATPNEVYQKILSGSILRSLRQMLGPNAGQFRVQELKMLEQAFGNQGLTLNANKVVMDMIDRENERAVLVGQMANEYLKTHHTLDASFESELANFERKNPVFDPTAKSALLNIAATGDPNKQPSTGAAIPTPSGPPQIIINRSTGERRQLNPATGKYEPIK